MRIFITGATGLLGSRLIDRLTDGGDDVVALSRHPSKVSPRTGLEVIEGDPTCPGAWQQRLNGCDAVVHLACSGNDPEALTARGLKALRERRLDSIFQIMTALETASSRPGRMILLTNRLALGTHPDGPPAGLAELIRAWEAQALKHLVQGVCVTVIRAGFLLEPGLKSLADTGESEGGSNSLGWIHIDDLVDCLLKSLHEGKSGLCEAVAPQFPDFKDVLSRVHALEASPRSPARPAPSGEAKALLSWPLPVGGDSAVAPVDHDYRFSDVQKALEDLKPPVDPGAFVPEGRPELQEGPTVARPRRLVVLPCEGLLLLKDGRLHPSSVSLVNTLQAAGLLVVLASSRSGRLCLGFARQLGIVTPLIAGDGSVLVDPARSEAIRTELLGADRIAGVAMAVRTAETGAIVVVERGVHVATDHPSELPVGLRELVTIDERVDSSALFSRPATRMFLQAPPRRLDRALTVIRDTWWRERIIAIHEHAPGVVAITATSADRGVALQRVESAMGMQRRSSLVVASTERDLGMLEFAGVGLAHPGLPASHAEDAHRVLESDDLLEIGQALIRADLASRVRAATPRS